LVSVAESDPGTPNPETVDFTTVYDWRTRSHSFEHMSLYRGADGAIVDHGEPELLRGMRVNYDFFDTLGVSMHLGRTFLREEDRPDRRYVVILSHGLWVRRFGGPKYLRTRLKVERRIVTVVGVLPAGLRSQVWIRRSFASTPKSTMVAPK